MKQSNNENFFSKIKAFYHTKTGHMTVFFVFYFFFFLFLAFFLKNNIDNRNDSSLPKDNVNDNISSNEMFNTQTIIDDNYYYQYELYEDGITTVFNGRINEKNEDVQKYSFNYFLNIYNVRQLIKNSKYLSKEVLEDKSIIYKYSISTETVRRYVNDDISDNLLNNDIIVKVNDKLVVTSIEFDLSNYAKDISKFELFKIILKYSEVGFNE